MASPYQSSHFSTGERRESKPRPDGICILEGELRRAEGEAKKAECREWRAKMEANTAWDKADKAQKVAREAQEQADSIWKVAREKLKEADAAAKQALMKRQDVQRLRRQIVAKGEAARKAAEAEKKAREEEEQRAAEARQKQAQAEARQKQAEAEARQKQAEDEARQKQAQADAASRQMKHAQAHTALKHWCAEGKKLSQNLRQGQPSRISNIPMPPMKYVDSRCSQPACTSARKELGIDFCKHTLDALVKFCAKRDGGCQKVEEARAKVDILRLLRKTWHPDRFMSGSVRLRRQGEELAKIVGCLYTENT